MKHLIFFLLFCPVVLPAQVVTKDTTWQESGAGGFFEVRRVEWSNGEVSQNRRLVGDTATVFKNYLSAYIREGERMATAAADARNFDKNMRTMLQRRDTILAAIGLDITDTLAKMYAVALLENGWQIGDSLFTDVTFNINAQGQLRYQIFGGQARNAYVVSKSLRLMNYGITGKPLDLYKMPGGNWVSIDDRVKMRFPGNQSRSAAKPPSQQRVEAETIKLEPVRGKTTKPKKKKN